MASAERTAGEREEPRVETMRLQRNPRSLAWSGEQCRICHQSRSRLTKLCR
jgi:hypothetical protein